jgi:hypothetical protein
MAVHRRLLAPLAAGGLFVLGAQPASALLLIDIDKSTQRMTVSLDGQPLYRWPVSTGLRAYDTPSGTYTPFRMEKDHFSREWDDAPMPHSIFFTKKGHAIHGTTHLRAIGRPASHGCVRLEPQNARILFDLVRREGMANTRVVLRGVTPPVAPPAVARREPLPLPPPTMPSPTRMAPGYVAPQWPARERHDERQTGYWLIYPDGSRVFVDRERDPRWLPPPPPFPWGGAPGWE